MCDEQFFLTATLDFMAVNKNIVFLDVTQGTTFLQNTVTYLKNVKLSQSTTLRHAGEQKYINICS